MQHCVSEDILIAKSMDVGEFWLVTELKPQNWFWENLQ